MVPKIVDAEVRRQEVVEAAFRIIVADGLERASLREVADEAGLAVGSVRHYFANSDDLLVSAFAAVVDRISGRLQRSLAALETLPRDSVEFEQGVLGLLGELLPLNEESATDACVWIAFRNAARVKPVLAPEASRSHREVAAVMGRLVLHFIGGDVPQEALVVEAERLMATLDGLCMHALLQPEWMTAEICRDVLQAHLAGLGMPLAVG